MYQPLSDKFPVGQKLDFQLTSEFEPAGDQPEAINQLITGIETKERSQVMNKRQFFSHNRNQSRSIVWCGNSSNAFYPHMIFL